MWICSGAASDPATEIAPGARDLAHPVIGYFGSLHEWIDLDLIEWLARARPAWTFMLVGHAAVDVAHLAALPNVRLAGAQPYESLPTWAKAFDAAIIPYRRTRQTENANPLKLREYLATGKPVVSVRNPEIENSPPGWRSPTAAKPSWRRSNACSPRTRPTDKPPASPRLPTRPGTAASPRSSSPRPTRWHAAPTESITEVFMQATPNGKLKVAIVGAGYVASHHLAALKRLDFVEVVGICDLDNAAAHALANKFDIPIVAASLADLAALSPQAIYVLTPPASHCALALQALDMGCHVLVEKPMAESVAECQTMMQRAAERGLVLSVNHSDRLDPMVVQALDAVRAGKIGDLLSVDILRSSEYPDYAGGPLPASVRQGSYPFRDLGRARPVRARGLPRSAVRCRCEIPCERPRSEPQVRRVACRHERRAWPRPHAAVVECAADGKPHRRARYARHHRSGSLPADLPRAQGLPGPKFIGIVATAFLSGLADVFRVPWNVVRFATGALRPSPGIQAGAADFARALHTQSAPPVPAEEGLRAVALMESVCAAADAERSADIEARYVQHPPVDALVTGAAGFLGRAVVEALLARGKSVRVLVRNPAAAKSFGTTVQVLVGDLGDPRAVDFAVAGARQVFHVGAAMRGSARAFEAGTVWGTRNIVDACLAHQTERLIYVSSLSVLDHAGRDAQASVNEQSALEPEAQRRGAYTQTKLSAENLVRSAIRERGLRAVIIRPGQIFGPRRRARDAERHDCARRPLDRPSASRRRRCP